MLKSKIIEFVNNPYDLKINLDLGYLYEQEKQYASAISHYMRGAEYGLDNSYDDKSILISECLYRAAEVFHKLGSRIHSTKALVLHAISNTPELPQLYLFLTKIHEQQGEWNECNTIATIGLSFIENYKKFSHGDKGYYDTLNELLFQKAISNYYIGRVTKAKLDLEILKNNKYVKQWMLDAINNSLNTIGYPVLYNQIGYEKVISNKEVFKDNSFVSFSQCLQDVFVSTLLGKRGTYLEIGSGDPLKNNNTYLLERDYDWEGISLETDESMVTKFNSTRKNKSICTDATTFDYSRINLPDVVEYLQVDCEPPYVTLEALYNIPFDKHKFVFITFEHDSYREPGVRKKSRNFLKHLGYELLISDVSYNNKDSWEDWWIHPELILNYTTREKINTVKNTDLNIKNIINIFL
jgi:hypothetical protein